MDKQKEIPIKPDYRELRKDLLINLIKQPNFRQQWADLVSHNEYKQIILNCSELETQA